MSLNGYKMDPLLQEVHSLRQDVETMEIQLELKKEVLKEKIHILQSNCKHLSFKAEHNGDCHKSGYYYTCCTCEYWTSLKPKDVTIIYN
jgi:lipopolysaccharide biosynthesis regulator YciM